MQTWSVADIQNILWKFPQILSMEFSVSWASISAPRWACLESKGRPQQLWGYFLSCFPAFSKPRFHFCDLIQPLLSAHKGESNTNVTLFVNPGSPSECVRSFSPHLEESIKPQGITWAVIFSFCISQSCREPSKEPAGPLSWVWTCYWQIAWVTFAFQPTTGVLCYATDDSGASQTSEV